MHGKIIEQLHESKTGLALAWRYLFFFFTVLPLLAAPDPDLFDGRAVPPAAEASGSSGSTQPGGGPMEKAPATGSSGQDGSPAEDRDLEDVGSSGGGASVQENRSKTEGESGGNAGGSPASTGSTETPAAGASGSSEATQSAGATSGGGAGSESSSPSGGGSGRQEPRSFEDFGFGGATSKETVEVNRSKESGQSSSTSNPITRPTSEPPTGLGNEATGGSQPKPGNVSGDYGTNLPSGL